LKDLKYVRVTFADGDQITTHINGDYCEVCEYYLGNKFNIGSAEDNIQTASKVEFFSDKVNGIILTVECEGDSIFISSIQERECQYQKSDGYRTALNDYLQNAAGGKL